MKETERVHITVFTIHLISWILSELSIHICRICVIRHRIKKHKSPYSCVHYTNNLHKARKSLSPNSATLLRYTQQKPPCWESAAISGRPWIATKVLCLCYLTWVQLSTQLTTPYYSSAQQALWCSGLIYSCPQTSFGAAQAPPFD